MQNKNQINADEIMVTNFNSIQNDELLYDDPLSYRLWNQNPKKQKAAVQPTLKSYREQLSNKP
jgi:hypothetical protein